MIVIPVACWTRWATMRVAAAGEGRGGCAVIGHEGEVLAGDPGTGGELLAEGEACCFHQPAGADARRAVGEVVDGSAVRAQAAAGACADDRAEEDASSRAAIVVAGVKDHPLFRAHVPDGCDGLVHENPLT